LYHREREREKRKTTHTQRERWTDIRERDKE
jgi:hypothetical protein